MPSKRAKPDSLLEEALEALSDGLTACQAPWMVIGGIAVIARGVRRFTTDIDAAVLAEAPEILTALDHLLARTSD